MLGLSGHPFLSSCFSDERDRSSGPFPFGLFLDSPSRVGVTKCHPGPPVRLDRGNTGVNDALVVSGTGRVGDEMLTPVLPTKQDGWCHFWSGKVGDTRRDICRRRCRFGSDMTETRVDRGRPPEKTSLVIRRRRRRFGTQKDGRWSTEFLWVRGHPLGEGEFQRVVIVHRDPSWKIGTSTVVVPNSPSGL